MAETEIKNTEPTESKYISVTYKLYTIEDGDKDLAEEATTLTPFDFISGMGLTLQVFEDNLSKLKAGDTFDFTIKKEDAYGEYDDTQIATLPKSTFEINGKFDSKHITEGAIIPLMTADGEHFNGSVAKIGDTDVTIDLNHPLAGCDLQFVGKVLESRPATGEEMARVAKILSGEGGCGGCEGGNCESGNCKGGGCGGCGGH